MWKETGQPIYTVSLDVGGEAHAFSEAKVRTYISTCGS